MRLDRVYYVVLGRPGAAALVRYTPKDAPLVRLSAAIHDSRASAEASTEWASVAQAGDQADEFASKLVKGSPDDEEDRQFARRTNANGVRKSVLNSAASKIEALGGFGRQPAAAA